MAHYYSDMAEFNRLSYDSRNTSQQAGILIFARMFPIAASDADLAALRDLTKLAK